MMGKDYDSSANSPESPTMSSNTSDGDTSSSGSVRHVTWHSHAYDDEPLAEPGEQAVIVPDDADRIPPATLEQRSNCGIPLDQWCSCQCCQTELLEGVAEYRCCKEMTPALHKMTFDGSIENISCITQHGDFGPMIHQAVLENAEPLLRDRNGRSYRRRSSQSMNQYLRAVAYRWLIK